MGNVKRILPALLILALCRPGAGEVWPNSATVAPTGSLAFLFWRNAASFHRTLKQDPSFAVEGMGVMMMKDVESALEARTGLDLEEAMEIFGEEMAVVVLEGKRPASTETVLLAKRADGYPGKLYDQLMAAKGGTSRPEKIGRKSATAIVLGKREFWHLPVRGYLAVSTSPEALGGLVYGSGGFSLPGIDPFRKAMKLACEEGDEIGAYVNMDKLLERAVAKGNPTPERIERRNRMLRAAGLDNMVSFGFGSVGNSRGTPDRAATAYIFTDTPPRGLLALFGKRKVTAGDIQLLPQGVALAAVARHVPGVLYDKFFEIGRIGDPEGAASAKQKLLDKLGFDLRAQLIGALAGEMVFYAMPVQGSSASSLAFAGASAFDMALALRATNRVLVKKTVLPGLAKAFAADAKTQDVDGIEAYVCPASTPCGLAPCFAVDGNYLIVTSSVQALKGFRSGRAGGGAINESAHFQALLDGVGPNVSALLYLDPGIMQGAAKGHTAPALAAVSHRSDGLRFRWAGENPARIAAGIAGAGANVAQAMARARAQAASTKDMANLRVVYAKAVAFKSAQGRLPKPGEEFVGAPPASPHGTAFGYEVVLKRRLTGDDKPEEHIFAASTYVAPDGRRAVLFADGRTVLLPDEVAKSKIAASNAPPASQPAGAKTEAAPDAGKAAATAPASKPATPKKKFDQFDL